RHVPVDRPDLVPGLVGPHLRERHPAALEHRVVAAGERVLHRAPRGDLYPPDFSDQIRRRSHAYSRRSLEVTVGFWGVQGGVNSPLVEASKTPDIPISRQGTVVNSRGTVGLGHFYLLENALDHLLGGEVLRLGFVRQRDAVAEDVVGDRLHVLGGDETAVP